MYDFFRTFIATVFNYMDEGICFTDVNKTIIYWNNGAETITGYPLNEVVGENCDQIIAAINQVGTKPDALSCPTTQAAQISAQQGHRLVIAHKNGQPIPVLLRIFPVYDDDAELTGFIHLIIDNSCQRVEHAKMNALTKAAYVDSLSGLFSKQYLENRLQDLLSAAPDRRKAFGLLYLSIVDFRAINEKYGVSKADQLLKMAAGTLSSGISTPNLIGRWHGASFIVIINTTNKSLILLFADKLKALIAEAKFVIGEDPISLQLAVGHTVSQEYDTVNYMLERAVKVLPEERYPEAPVAPEKIRTDKDAFAVGKPSPKNRFYSAGSRRK